MKYFSFIFSFLVLLGCTTKIAQQDISKLNGYWEIEQVTFPNGETKEFTVNPTVDYIELDGLKGFRKKMQPKFDGSFTTSNDAEPFLIQENNGEFKIHYKNAMSEWSEVIKSISQDKFSVTNHDTLTYTYKRFQSINLEE
ncbi:hypothetical protein FEE95_18365 [Maribacter algarum]|uniref:Lipocalin-like domain-containing protein n=1 Tax=Maribacter algarum (ex Zhang et al. 2020) TaxID=2578118 RepID=A0A5S3PK58_9FLAO|nr:hypothetical protein [Maribacter algarum]TMM53861.1 hypothetical protein FEE95_18365 [Maribacter algarum]